MLISEFCVARRFGTRQCGQNWWDPREIAQPIWSIAGDTLVPRTRSGQNNHRKHGFGWRLDTIAGKFPEHRAFEGKLPHADFFRCWFNFMHVSLSKCQFQTTANYPSVKEKLTQYYERIDGFETTYTNLILDVAHKKYIAKNLLIQAEDARLYNEFRHSFDAPMRTRRFHGKFFQFQKRLDSHLHEFE